MLRIVLWAAVGCAVLLAALALSRGVRFTSDPRPPAETPSAETAAEPAAARAPEPEPAAPPAEPEPEIDIQVHEDAAATGMTTVEPGMPSMPQAPAPSEAPPEFERR